MGTRWMLATAAIFLAAISPPALAAQAQAIFVANYLDLRTPASETGKALVMQWAADAHAAHGSLWAIALQEIARPNRFVVMEAWQDQGSFAAHEAAANTVTLRRSLDALSRSPLDQRVNTGLSLDARFMVPWPQALYIVTHVDTLPTQADAAALMQRLSTRSRTEHGNLRYETYRQLPPHANHFTVFAIWATRRDFEASEDAAPWHSFREALAANLGSPFDDRLYRPLTIHQR